MSQNDSDFASSSGITGGVQTALDEKAPVNTDYYTLAAMQALGSVIKGQSVGCSVMTMSQLGALASGTMRFQAVYLPTAQTVTGIKFYQGVQGSYTADASNVLGLYTYSGGTLTKVAETADDGNLWKAAAGSYSSKDFVTPYAAQPGLYFVAALYHTSAQTTAPTIGGWVTPVATNALIGDFTNSAKLHGTLAAQTALPASQAMSGITVSTIQLWFGLY